MRLIGMSRAGLGKVDSMTNQREASCSNYREAQRAFNLSKVNLVESDMDRVHDAEHAVAACDGIVDQRSASR